MFNNSRRNEVLTDAQGRIVDTNGVPVDPTERREYEWEQRFAALEARLTGLQGQHDYLVNTQVRTLDIADHLVSELEILFGATATDQVRTGTQLSARIGKLDVSVNIPRGVLSIKDSSNSVSGTVTAIFSVEGSLNDNDVRSLIGFNAQVNNPTKRGRFWSGAADTTVSNDVLQDPTPTPATGLHVVSDAAAGRHTA